MALLVDTSILARLANTADEQHLVSVQTVVNLHGRGETLHVTPQVLVECRNVATRPKSSNGLGLPSAEAAAQAATFEASFPLLAETLAIYPIWKSIVEGLGVIGKQVHDARLVAVCHAHDVTHLLTFNVAHFARIAGFRPGLTVVKPGCD